MASNVQKRKTEMIPLVVIRWQDVILNKDVEKKPFKV